jgi:hypothetical protein
MFSARSRLGRPPPIRAWTSAYQCITIDWRSAPRRGRKPVTTNSGTQHGADAGVDRRAALRTGLLAGAGLAGFAVGVLSFPGPAAATIYRQYGWLWCSKCEGLFYSWNGTAGRCAAGGGHDGSISVPYWLFYSDRDSEPIVGFQLLWVWCGRCQALAYAGNGRFGFCPAGGRHNHSGTLNYGLLYGAPAEPGLQTGWAWCHKCESLFFGPHQAESRCPLSGHHDGSTSFPYDLYFVA